MSGGGDIPDDIPQTDDVGELLHYAARKGRTDIIKALIEKGALEHIKEKGTAQAEPPLHAACRFGHSDVVRALLAAGVDPSVRDAEGRTPYSLCDTDEVKKVRHLAEAGRRRPSS